MNWRRVLALPALALGIMAAAVLPTSGQDPHPVAQPTPTAAPPATPSPTPAPEAAKDEKEKPAEEKKWNV